MRLNRSRCAWMLSVAVVLLLVVPEFIAIAHLSQTPHHEADHCAICTQISAMLLRTNHVSEAISALISPIVTFALVLTLGIVEERPMLDTLVSLNIKLTN